MHFVKDSRPKMKKFKVLSVVNALAIIWDLKTNPTGLNPSTTILCLCIETFIDMHIVVQTL